MFIILYYSKLKDKNKLDCNLYQYLLSVRNLNTAYTNILNIQFYLRNNTDNSKVGLLQAAE